jgi:hypothetical protein
MQVNLIENENDISDTREIKKYRWLYDIFTYSMMCRVRNFRQKNKSAEDGIDGKYGYFRWNSGCSAEQKTSEFRSEPFCGRENNSEFRSLETKIEAYSQSSLPNSSAEEKTTRNSVWWNK